MSAERLKVLEMIEQGKITAAEGLELLAAIEETDVKGSSFKDNNRFLRRRWGKNA